MKAIIYAGISLFSVASVYGVVDFYYTQKTGTLNNLYKEDDLPVPKRTQNDTVSVHEKNDSVQTEVPVLDKTMLTSDNIHISKSGKQKVKRTIRMEEFSRGKIKEPIIMADNKLTKAGFMMAKRKEKKVAEIIASTKVVQPGPLERKISFASFSRAPLKIRRPLIPTIVNTKQ